MQSQRIDFRAKSTVTHAETPLDFRGARIFLGSLRSKEYVGLVHEHLQAIQRFWTTIFDISGAQTDFALMIPDCSKKSFRH